MGNTALDHSFWPKPKFISLFNLDEDSRKTYVGFAKNRISSGHGTMIWKNGSNYTGQWINGLRSGSGLIHYLGEWTDPRWKDGESYEGFWSNDMKNGVGVYTHSQDCEYFKYEGHFKVKNFFFLLKIFLTIFCCSSQARQILCQKGFFSGHFIGSPLM